MHANSLIRVLHWILFKECCSIMKKHRPLKSTHNCVGFDLGGVYDVVNRHEAIGHTMEDGRRVDIASVDQGNETKVIETFDAESSNPAEFQQACWQAIMDNFKVYTEQN
jgi:hypothetical protein